MTQSGDELRTLSVDRDVRAWANTIVKTSSGRDLTLTVADAATRSGLTLDQAESGLNWLIEDYRGRLAVGEQGDLLFKFPVGFSKPWKTREAFHEMALRLGRASLPILKVMVKVWILVVVVVYVLIFLAILVAIMFASKGKDDERSSRRSSDSGFGTFLMFRIVFDLIGDALWALFVFGDRRRLPPRSSRSMPRKSQQHFYESIFAFIFGPEGEKVDANADRKRLLAFIRSRKGRIVVGDVVALLGCTNARAEQILTRLMVDYKGDVSVDDSSAILFSFPSIRKTAETDSPVEVSMCWQRPETVPPLTGISSGATALIMGLNGFNLIMSMVAMTQNLVLANLPLLFDGYPLTELPYRGFPIFLGLFPFVFSSLLFAIPAVRWFLRKKAVLRAAVSNGLRAVLKEVFANDRFRHAREKVIALFTQAAETTQKYPSAALKLAGSQELEASASIGGGRFTAMVDSLALDLEADIDIDDHGSTWYAFRRFEIEQRAVRQSRLTAPRDEADPGEIVFS